MKIEIILLNNGRSAKIKVPINRLIPFVFEFIVLQNYHILKVILYNIFLIY